MQLRMTVAQPCSIYKATNLNNTSYLKQCLCPFATSCNFTLLNVRSHSNKFSIINDRVTSSHLDFLFLTENWLKPGEYNQFFFFIALLNEVVGVVA